MAPPQLITLLTDFGTTDAYVGIVKGILLARAPQARLVDLVHAADSGSLYAAAYLLMSASPYFPPGTVHLVLTNPGSGPDRRIIAAAVDSQYVVAPDNGVAAPLLDERPPGAVVTVQNDRFLLEATRHTFHSRLIYAPAAAALATGVRLDDLGPATSQWTPLPQALATAEPDGSILGEVVHIDRFGNLVTNIQASQLPSHPRISVGSTIIDPSPTPMGRSKPAASWRSSAARENLKSASTGAAPPRSSSCQGPIRSASRPPRSAATPKTEVLRYLGESFAVLRRAAATVTEKNAFEPFKGPFSSSPTTRLELIVLNTGRRGRNRHLIGVDRPATW